MKRTPSAAAPLRVLFICLGNICRSPLAEGLFARAVAEANLADLFHIDSAGTGSWHVGELAEPRTRQVAASHGVVLTHRARQFIALDFERYDYLLCADESNLGNVLRLKPNRLTATPVVCRLRDFDPDGPGDVEDPYALPLDAFERGFHNLSRVTRALLTQLRSDHSF